jgi:DNA-binding response OmpR family regulator
MWRAGRRARVLVADGDELALMQTAVRLGRAGYEVLVARDGEEALARAAAEHPDLCVIDAVMPKLNGYDVTRRLRADTRTSDVPILLLTALAHEARGLDSGADGYMPKPCSPHELRTRVDALLTRRR